MRKFRIIFVLNLALAALLSAQDLKRSNTWIVGTYLPDHCSGIDFNAGFPDTFSVTSNMNFFYTNAGICDTNGQTLLYTNGIYIANRNNNRLLNSTDYNPTTTFDTTYGYLVQGVTILAYCGLNDQYVVLHENGEIFDTANFYYQPLALRYSLIDLALDNGLGGIMVGAKNITLINDTLTQGKITACKHGNGRDWWVLCHRWRGNLFYKVLITPNSFSVDTQSIGAYFSTIDVCGQACFTKSGDKYVFLHQNTHLDIFDFDRCNGNLALIDSFNIPNAGVGAGAVGCAFSPSGRFLYVCNNLEMYQYDMQAANISSSVTTVAQWDSTMAPLATFFFMMSLATDGKIYISTGQGTNVLHVINYPDSLGLACNVIQHGLTLPSINALALPNMPNYGLEELSGSACDTITSTIELLNYEPIQFYPNPFKEEFSIYRMNAEKDIECTILSSIGQKLFNRTIRSNEHEARINFKNYAPGLYILMFNSSSRRTYFKIIKE